MPTDRTSKLVGLCIDRFRTELEAGQPDGSARPRRNRLRLGSRVVRQRLPPAWRRLMK